VKIFLITYSTDVLETNYDVTIGLDVGEYYFYKVSASFDPEAYVYSSSISCHISLG